MKMKMIMGMILFLQGSDKLICSDSEASPASSTRSSVDSLDGDSVSVPQKASKMKSRFTDAIVQDVEYAKSDLMLQVAQQAASQAKGKANQRERRRRFSFDEQSYDPKMFKDFK